MPTPADAHYLGQVLNNEIRAVVVYCGFYGKSCCIHVGSKGNHWATKSFLRAVFDYPFNKLKLKVIIGTVAGNNEKALKLDRHLGFKDVATIPDAHDEGDLVMLEMRPSFCRWL
jgi:RimJ/RimL family protein N-acetyltransferase